MIDMHIHILPGLDDGAGCMEEALLMAELALDSGVDAMAVTPHSHQIGRYENYYDRNLKAAFQKFREALRERKLPLKIYPGMEIFAHRDIRERILSGQVIGLNHSDYYLIEFAFGDYPEYIERILREMRLIGKIPVIAHPERYICVQREPGLAKYWMDMGCLTQVNKGSPLGWFGPGAERAALYLLNHRLVSLVASDAHGSTYRTPDMEEIRDFLELNYGMDTAQELLEGQAERILFR